MLFTSILGHIMYETSYVSVSTYMSNGMLMNSFVEKLPVTCVCLHDSFAIRICSAICMIRSLHVDRLIS